MEEIEFFNNLKEKDFYISVSKKWKVKDVLSHLVGWEREVLFEILNVFEKGNNPWFLLTDDYNKFNDKIYEEFKNYSPKKLIKELDKWNKEIEKAIKNIGEEKIKKSIHSSWIFDKDRGGNSHFKEHIKQIKKILKK